MKVVRIFIVILFFFIIGEASSVEARDMRVTFAGDLMMDWSVKTTINQKGADYPFTHIKKV